MAIERTAANLAAFCLQVVGTPYWMGCYGQKSSRALYNQKKADYPQYYPPKSWTEASFTDDFGKRVTDCAGLIKWFLWSNNMTDKSPSYRASEDWGATTMFKNCTETGKIGTLPAAKIGICVFNGNDTTKTHVGVIVDNDGTVVEAKGHAYGTVKSKASSWDYWGKLRLIKYDDAPAPKDTYTVSTKYDPLTVRKEPTSASEEIDKVAKGTTFVSTEVVKGQDVKGCDAWVKYNDGYVSGYYLTPTPKVPDTPEEPAAPQQPTEKPAPVTPVDPAPVDPAKKTVDELAHEVIEGQWGNGQDRVNRLTAAGYNYSEVQGRVNEILGVKGKTYTVDVDADSWLNIRVAPNSEIKVGKLYRGDKVTVYEERDGWGRIGTAKWVCMSHLK